MFDIARCIPKLDLDQAFMSRSLQIVNAISTIQFPQKAKINRFSFASKYASWHRPDVYPMWDGHVQNYLTCLRKLYRTKWDTFAEGFPLSSNQWGYPEFHALMTRLRIHFSLAEISFKNLDKFLWWHGGSNTAGKP